MIEQALAIDEIRQHFNDGWVGSTPPTGLGEMPEIRWQGKPNPTLPPDFYAYFAHRIVKSPQSAHMTDAIGGSKAIFDTSGIVTICVYAAMKAVDANHIGGLLAQRARDIFRGAETPGGVWFRNAQSDELENDGKSYRFLVTVAFEFSEQATPIVGSTSPGEGEAWGEMGW
jgi:hypothetical protein